MTLSAYSQNYADTIISTPGISCGQCDSAHQSQKYKGETKENAQQYQSIKGLLKINRMQDLMEHAPCMCECHNLQIKKPQVDVPFPYERAKKELTRDTMFEEKTNAYFTNEGVQLTNYLRGQGRDFYKLESIGTSNLEGAIAAVAHNNENAILLGNRDFENKVEELARFYGVSQNVARRYVFDHETVHLSQKGRAYDDHFAAEYDVEGTLLEFYSKLGEKEPGNADYKALAGIARDRHASVQTNYANKDSAVLASNE